MMLVISLDSSIDDPHADEAFSTFIANDNSEWNKRRLATHRILEFAKMRQRISDKLFQLP